jgi:hypothetical protein
MPAAEPSDYDQGVVAGRIDARLAGHDKHFADLNGSIKDLREEVHALVLGVQRLGDAADADRATAISLAEALEKADAARRANSETRWTPLARLIAVIVAAAAVAGVIVAYVNFH